MNISTTRKILLVVAFISIFLFALFQGGFLSWFLFTFTGPFLLYCIGLFLFVDIKKISFHREILTKKKIANHSLEVKITVKNDNWYPILFLYVEEEISDGLLQTFVYHQPRTSFYFLMKKEIEWKYTIEKVARGKHSFYGLRIRLGDIFGFCVCMENIAIQEEIIVYPEIIPIKIEKGSYFLEDGSLNSNNTVNIHHTLPISVREYQPGDKMSWVNWKATAKRQQLMTKEFENRKSVDTTIILDAFLCNQLEVAISFTASLISAFMNGKSNITLQYLQPVNAHTIFSGDTQQLDKIMYDLSLLKGQSTTDFHRFQSLITNLRKSQIIYIILPQLTDQWIARINELGLHTNIYVFVMKQEHQYISQRDKELLRKVKRGNNVHYIKETLFQHNLNQVLKNR